MEKRRFLHVVHLPLISRRQIAQALRAHRLAGERCESAGAMLFFCDLQDAQAAALPTDADLIRCVQSGVMSMNARRPGRYLFLVRKRQRSDAHCMYLGEHQQTSVRKVMNSLIQGKNTPPFEASNISTDSLNSAFDAVLITDARLSFLPDTPARMLHALFNSDLPALKGEIHIPHHPEEPLFSRLVRSGFSLLPPFFLGKTNTDMPLAAIYLPKALDADASITSARDCIFLDNQPLTLSDFFARAAIDYVRCGDHQFFLPALQTALLLLAAFAGWQPLAFAALLPAEWHALCHPRTLPCALIRLTFLPQHALTAVNALLKRRLSRRQTHILFSCGSGVCPFFGGILIFLALRSSGALVVSLVVGLLWLAAPAIDRALTLPSRERIPLDESEQRQLRSLSESAFYVLSPDAASPSHLLAACAGCMLGLLEPDEAARRCEGMLERLKVKSAFDTACLLACAQYLTERMADCDAALRSLPSALESRASLPAPLEDSPLSALLAAAESNLPAPKAIHAFSAAHRTNAMEALFLPRERMPQSSLLLPVTHPHTYLMRLHLNPEQEKSDPPSPQEEANRFLILACAALNAPFFPLLMRSSRVAPYAPLLDLV